MSMDTTTEICPLLDAYLELVGETESPLIYHRWCMLTALSSIFERRIKFDLPFGAIYPNQYVVLIGDPATRKSTAIKICGKLVKDAGYSKISGGRTSPEQFLADLHQGFDILTFTKQQSEAEFDQVDGIADWSLELDTPKINMGGLTKDKVSGVMIAEGELLEFLGMNNVNFASILTDMWDNHTHKDIRSKSGDKFRIKNPTVNLLGGATHTTFKKIFPFETIGQGLLSRFILVYASGPRAKCFSPKPFDTGDYNAIVDYIRRLLTWDGFASEGFTFSDGAYQFSRHLYESSSEDLQDPRFHYYNGRRDTHYRKLCLILAASNFRSTVTEEDCFLANTILSYTEKFMPAALGEFGFDKAGEQVEMVYSILARAPGGLSLDQLLSAASAVVHNVSELASNLVKLSNSGRIERIAKAGTNEVRYTAVERIVRADTQFANYNLLREFRENPTFTAGSTINNKLEEYELSAELNRLHMMADKQTGAIIGGKKKPGRPRKNQEQIFGGDWEPPKGQDSDDWNLPDDFGSLPN